LNYSGGAFVWVV
jgi:hypothetical protein